MSIILSLCFTLNVLAASGTVQEFERAFDDYQYSLNVEWDQKDQDFLNLKSEELTAKTKALMDKGLTRDEILSLLESKAKDKTAFAALKLRLTLLDKSSTKEELIAGLQNASKDFYSKGASWNGQVVIFSALSVAVIAFIVQGIYWDMTHKCMKTESRYGCYEDCHGVRDDICYTTCGYRDVCTEYVKK